MLYMRAPGARKGRSRTFLKYALRRLRKLLDMQYFNVHIAA